MASESREWEKKESQRDMTRRVLNASDDGETPSVGAFELRHITYS